MALNVPGVNAVVLFYILILGTGVWAAQKSRRAERKSDSSRTEVVLLGDRNISLVVCVFLSFTATWVGGGFILGVAEAVYTPKMGLIWALMPLQYSMSFLIGGLFFAKPMRDSLWLCVPFLLLNQTSVNIAKTALTHMFQEPWVGTLDKDSAWKWIDDFLMLGLGSVSFQSFHQRTLSASSSATAQLMCYAAAFVIAILGIPPILVGAVAASTDWNLTAYGSPAPHVRGEHSLILPLTLQYLTPPYISIIGIGAVAAAVMSSTDSGLLSATSVFSSNIYKNVLRSQASDSEMQWVIRISVVVVGLVGTPITFYTNSTLVLWILGADVSYTLMFPHLVSVLFFKVTNGYGAAVGYITGMTLRILLGENILGIPVVLHLPGCTLEDGVYVQKSPVRTVSMLCTLVTILVFSCMAVFIFNRGLLPEKWDVFNVKRSVSAPPADAGSDSECEVNTQGVALQTLSQTGT
ncbi:high affinity choline transporter 1-like [Odontesthes bonariensis]|uniref:high affinity choline transporter 1-like n=1 Tax=Odontesthes bonariensis TaxID=219752 RepID=UPI003F58E7B0